MVSKMIQQEKVPPTKPAFSSQDLHTGKRVPTSASCLLKSTVLDTVLDTHTHIINQLLIKQTINQMGAYLKNRQRA